MKNPIISWRNMARGALIYSGGDLAACLILNRFSIGRTLGLVVVGATLYALEIPNYFRWIDRKTAMLSTLRRTLGRTGLALLYFNPVWIARHLGLIRLFSGNPLAPGQLIRIGMRSFLWNIPIAILANYLIQNRIHLRHRFMASAIFSALMAVYYALSEVFFK